MYYEESTKLEISRHYADVLGFAVFPCHSIENGMCSCGDADCRNTAKHPLTANGVKDATKDAETLKRYFSGDYERANIAVATGEPSGIWVLDVDDFDAYQKICREYGGFPRTPNVETGGGGLHLYFRFDERCRDFKNAVKFAGGLDVRATGGYVLAPPSIHASGKDYYWVDTPEEVPFAETPEWLVGLVPKRSTLTIHDSVSLDERVSRYLERTPPAISGQAGHNHTFGVLCRLLEVFPELRERGEDGLLTLLTTWNGRCEPPWTEAELRHKLRDALAHVAENRDGPPVEQSDEVASPAVSVSDASVDAADDLDEEWPVLDADALHGLAGACVRAVEPHTESDPVALLITLIGAFGSCVGRSPYFRVGGDRHHVNLYACLVGASARARKGLSLGYVLHLFEGVDSDWTERRVNGLSSGEGVIHALRDEPVKERGGTFTVGQGVAEKRLWIVETEFGQTLHVMKRDGNTLSAVVRNAWDRGELHVLTRKDPLRASNAHVSILAHITLEELERALNTTDVWNGFANRFLWCCVRRSKLVPDALPPPLDELRQRLMTVTQKAKGIGEMRRSPAAAELWREVYPDLVAEKHGLWDAVSSRAEAQTLRLSMLYALLDGTDTIDVPHLRAALALWRYCDESARIIFNRSEGDTTLEAKIRRLVAEHPGIGRTELRDSISHKIKATELERALAWLAGRGEIERRFEIENGRRCERLYPVIGDDHGGGGALGRPPLPAHTSEPNAPTPQPSATSVEANSLTPRRPDKKESDAEADADTRVIEPAEFYARLRADLDAIDAECEAPNVPPAPLSELLDWRNSRGAVFYRRSDGTVWVSHGDHTLTPALQASIRANQETLRMFPMSA